MSTLPPNVHVSQHPCLLAKLSQLRSQDTPPKDVKGLIHDIALIVGCEALAKGLTSSPGPTDKTPLGFDYQTHQLLPTTVSLVPILRSGLGMVEAIQTLLPNPVPVHHLGLYREPTTLHPVEYYNNLPNHAGAASELAIILDPVIATGGTCAAAIQTLREWGTQRIMVLSVLGAAAGVRAAAAEWPAGVEIWLAGVDDELTDRGMLKPGLGDVGDRLFLTIGK
jgi:uracil phosphoribosyltransferase